MKKTVLIISLAGALVACNNASDTETTKGNTDTTDTTSVQDNTVNRDTAIRMNSGMIDTSSRKDTARK